MTENHPYALKAASFVDKQLLLQVWEDDWPILRTTLILIITINHAVLLKSSRNKKPNWVDIDVMLVSKYLALLSNHNRYYPHHYAPFLSDVRNISSLMLAFDLGKPFMPFQQLLGVLPSASKDLLPQCYQVTLSSCPRHVSVP